MRRTTRRVLEALGIMLFSSLPIYFLIKLGYIPASEITYVGAYGLSAIIYLVLSAFSLKKYLIAIRKNKRYFKANGILFGVQIALCAISMFRLSDELYTAFWGFTKPLRLFGFTRFGAALIFWLVYLLEIVFFPVDRAIYRKIREKRKPLEREKREIERSYL